MEIKTGKLRLIAIGIIVIIFLVLFLNLWPFVQINPGQRGLVIRLGALQPVTLSEGIHFKLPFVDSVQTVSIRIRKDEVHANAASRDAQQVNTVIAVNWRIRADKVGSVYQNIGDEQVVFDRIVAPAVAEVVKSSTAQITAEETLQKREALKNDIDKKLSKRLEKYGLILDDVSIVNIDFSPEFNAAIEAKQIAEQEAKKAKFTSDKAAQDAQSAINRAQGEAEAQRLQQQTLTEPLLRKLWIEKWDGRLPNYVAGENDVILQLPKE